MTIKATSKPEALSDELPWLPPRKRRDSQRHKERINKRCAKCGALISPNATWCRKCQPRVARQPGVTGNTTGYESLLYTGPLTRAMRYNMDLPQSMCPLYGSPACLTCDYQIPSWCPALDGQPDMSCDKCTMICKCNGLLKEEERC